MPVPQECGCCTNCPTKDCNNLVDLKDDRVIEQLLTNIFDEETHRRICNLDEVKEVDSTETLTRARLMKLVKEEESTARNSRSSQNSVSAVKTSLKKRQKEQTEEDLYCNIHKVAGHDTAGCRGRCNRPACKKEKAHGH